jgi:hypothetical protein
MIKDFFKIVAFFIAAFTIGAFIVIIKVLKTILEILFTPVIKNSMNDSLYVLIIKQIGVFILYTSSAIVFYLIRLQFNDDRSLMDILITMWCVMIVIEGIIPMVKEYIKK